MLMDEETKTSSMSARLAKRRIGGLVPTGEPGGMTASVLTPATFGCLLCIAQARRAAGSQKQRRRRAPISAWPPRWAGTWRKASKRRKPQARNLGRNNNKRRKPQARNLGRNNNKRRKPQARNLGRKNCPFAVYLCVTMNEYKATP